LSNIVNWSSIRHLVLVSYFTGVAIARIIYKTYNESNTEKNECDYSITKRIIVLYGLVIFPSFLLVTLGAWCSMYSYNNKIKTRIHNQRYLLQIISRSENFMIAKSVLYMVGFTIWSLRNIFTIIYLFTNDCMKDTSKIDKFWLLNFYFFTLFGYGIAVITLLIFPGAALYQCYR
jgi:hypothetical protein